MTQSDILSEPGNVSVDEFERPDKNNYSTYLPERDKNGYEEMFRQLKQRMLKSENFSGVILIGPKHQVS